jgi:hypothetical protein
MDIENYCRKEIFVQANNSGSAVEDVFGFGFKEE